MTRIAIVGAGLSGLTLARALSGRADVTIFEKSRGLGGRMATRRAEPFSFDHGAQYFTAKSAAFKAFLAPHLESGSVRPWHARIETLSGPMESRPYQASHPLYVASPAMNALCRALADGLDIRPGVRVGALKAFGQGTELFDDVGSALGTFDWVLSSAPAPQTAQLFSGDFCHQTRLADVRMVGCYTLMLGFDGEQELGFDAAFVENSPVGWIAVNASKPGRTPNFTLVIQSTNAWAEANLDAGPDDVIDILLNEARRLTGQPLNRPLLRTLQRWLYANVTKGADVPFLLDDNARLGACGDWCLRGRVEAAFESGKALGDAMIARL